MTRKTWTLDKTLPRIPCESSGVGHAAEQELAIHVPNPVEAALAAEMHEPRRRDFLLGRLAAARAVAQLGFRARPIAQRGSAPNFGEGLRGSISHSRGLALAVAIPVGEAHGVGVDIEQGRLSPRAARRITTAREHSWIEQAHDSTQASLRATLLFAVKESAFKALSPSMESPPRLDSIVVECSGRDGPFRALARSHTDIGDQPLALDVGWGVSGEAILAWALHRSV